jgi:hypothetical protein
LADIAVDSRDTAHEVIVAEIVTALATRPDLRGDTQGAAAATDRTTHDER